MAYSTENDADIRATRQANATWLALDSATKVNHLAVAQEFLDLTYDFKGQITDDTQGNAWPRIGVYDREGRLFDSDEIPDGIKNAEIELAFILADGGTLIENESQRAVDKVKAGPVEVVFGGSAQLTEASRMRTVDRHLRDLIIDRVSGGSGPRRRTLA